ncbi:non-ribosomal peptide synthetase [Spirosoma profusum]|uniref:non-ribosomal peptide synthetase n=1 Tax=Spirosoma profusum TaxID=2771354 RepID=UPI00293BE3CD|nr:amino acid adenylation domain-containing protein [Spirosoma profusum]
MDFDPFAGEESTRYVPITQSQQEIWTACQLGGDDANRAFNESISLRFDGKLHEGAFHLAWSDVVARHEALRVTFSPTGEQMCISDDLTVPLILQDLSDTDLARQAAAINEHTQLESHFLFDLESGPLARATLIKLGSTRWHFTLTVHHIICDGWSLGVLFQELGKLYTDYSEGNTAIPLPTPAQISQYSLDQQDFVQSDTYASCEAFWLSQFRSNVPTVSLPTDVPRPIPRTYACNRADFVLDADITGAIKRLALQTKSSLLVTLTAAFEVWLHQLTRQKEIVVGLPAAGQLAVDQYDLVGHCVHLLPLRSQFDPTYSFLYVVDRLRQELFTANENQRVTFGSLLQKLTIPRDPARIPLVPVVFNVDSTPERGITFGGLRQQLISNPRAYENFELSLNILGDQDEFRLLWSYNKQLFRATTIAQFNKSFVTLLQMITQRPDAPLASIGLALGKAEQRNIPDYSTHYQPYPHDKALTTLLSETASRFPNKVALRFQAESLTYKALDEQTNLIAHALRSHGVQSGDRVGLAIERSMAMITFMLGILKAGATYVPVDPQHPAERLSFIMNDAGCCLLLTSQAFQGRVKLMMGHELLIEDIEPTLGQYPTTFPEHGPTGQDIAYILYTSGTTGHPKGALIRHHSVTNVLYSVAREPGLTHTDKTIALATIAFDLAVVEIYTPLLVGAELIIVDSATARNAEALANLLSDTSITFVQTTPATFRMLLAAGWQGHDRLRAVSCAEALPMDLAQKLLTYCAELWNFYGPTETTIYATGKRILPTDEYITIGHPIANTRIYLVDETGQLAPEGQSGEICIAGEGVSGVYLNRPELTAEKFIDNPFSSIPEKLYRTGDLGAFAPGTATTRPDIVYKGRLDHQVKIRGFRIELAEIEHVLRKLPDVDEATVLAREYQPGDQRLVAYVVTRNTITERYVQHGYVSLIGEELQKWRQLAATSLPDYMVPTDFVMLPTLPITASGKLDRQALPSPVIHTFIPVEAGQADAPVQTCTPEEQMILSLWKAALHTNYISLDDNFFEIGGHSLTAVKIMAELAQLTGRRLPLSLLFEQPTVRKLATFLKQGTQRVSWKSLVPIKPTGTRKPLYIVHGAGLNVLLFSTVAQNLHADQPIYGLQARGLNNIDEPCQTIEEMAAHYVSEIVAHDPQGPYSLSGFSLGGVIAYEMARQLLEQGKQVDMVALFDAEAFESSSDVAWWFRKYKGLEMSGRKLFHTITLLKEHGWQGIKYKLESLDRRLVKKYWRSKGHQRFDYVLLRKAIEVYWQAKFGQTQQQEAILDSAFKIEAINDIALARFQLRPADLEVHVFKALIQTFYVADKDYYGWRNFARKGVHIHDVPGEHSYIFAPPNDKEFARILQKVLDSRGN